MSRLATFVVVVGIGCGGDLDTALDARPSPDAVSDAGVKWHAEHVGPSTGFVSAVAFAPAPDVVWISGDDASGLYRSSDGGTTLAPVTTAPLDWSAYKVAFSSDGQRVVAASHFGRGVAVSADAGATWQVIGDGLTLCDACRIYDAEVTDGGQSLLATGSGLYRETADQRFAPVRAPALETATGGITQLLHTPAGYLAGSHNGRIYRSPDGDAWTELTTADGAEITDLAAGALGVYVAFATGLVVRIPPAGAVEVIANPATDARFATALWTKLAVASLGSTDRIWIGVVADAARRSAGKLLVSSDGGASFAVRAAGLDGASIFAIAIDPGDPAHAVIGTIGDGAFVTRDAGVTWTTVAGDLRATAVLGFAQDPAAPDHLVIASSESLPGTPCLLEHTADGWARRRGLVDDARALAFDGAALVAGGFAGGPAIRRGASGPSGPFVVEPGVTGEVVRLVRTSHGMYSVGAVIARRGQDAWATVWPGPTTDLVETPDGLVSCGLGVYLSATGDFTDAVELPAPGKPWFACAIDAGGALVLAGDGELWGAVDLAAARRADGWRRIATPIDGVALLSVVAAGSTWVIGGGDVDEFASQASRSGVYASDDGGASWRAIDGDLWPSRTVYQLHRGRDANEVFAALWGGGLWRLRR